jgi:hypothetical protein
MHEEDRAMGTKRKSAMGRRLGGGGGRSESGNSRASANRRKTFQLCGQVMRTLNEILPGLDDEVLQSLYVKSVLPAPDDSRLLVTVTAGVPGEVVDPLMVMAHLGHAAANLRSEVAASITRKRAPTLVYEVEAVATGDEQGS